jgi:hypothetical protein
MHLLEKMNVWFGVNEPSLTEKALPNEAPLTLSNHKTNDSHLTDAS